APRRWPMPAFSSPVPPRAGLPVTISSTTAASLPPRPFDPGVSMRIGMIGLGRMGASMAQRLMLDGHECVAFDRDPQKVNALVEQGAVGAPTLEELIAWLPAPRAVWIMVPAEAVGAVVTRLAGLL